MATTNRPVFGRPNFTRVAAVSPTSSPERAPAAPASIHKPAPSVVAQKTTAPLSEEQRAVVESQAQITVVNAFAGTGKTSTAVEVAKAHPDESILYLCLNRANAQEAQGRFPKNVKALTTHSLAYSGMVRSIGSPARIVKDWRAMNLKSELRLSNYRTAALAQAVLKEFFKGNSELPGPEHVFDVQETWNATELECHQALDNAVTAWKGMCDVKSSVTIPHDAYLKMFALRAPQLGFDRVIFDESQDANPVTAQIISGQAANGTKVLCIGDRHQSIYGFRGSVNAMEDFANLPNAKVLALTQTWRFGPAIADLATTLLREFTGEHRNIVGMRPDGQWSEGKYTYLARTNARLIKVAAEREGRGIHWLGGPENYRLNLLGEAYKVFSGRAGQTDDKFMSGFRSWTDFKDYSDSSGDSEARILISIIEEYRDQTPDLLRAIAVNAVRDPRDAEIEVTTGHRSKGLEWDRVEIADDFEVVADVEAWLVDNPGCNLDQKLIQEVDLLYVAVTRAREAIKLNSCTNDWLANLDTNRQLRDQSAARMRRLVANVN